MKKFFANFRLYIVDLWDSYPPVKKHREDKLLVEFAALPVPFKYDEMKPLSEKFLALGNEK